MKAITEKWETVKATAGKLEVSNYNLAKWRQRGAVPGKWHIKLINVSNGKLKLKDFLEDA